MFVPLPSPASTHLPLCADDQQEIEHARTIVLNGLDNALGSSTERVFRTWIVSNGEGRERAREGVQNEVRAFFYARRTINNWKIPLCK